MSVNFINNMINFREVMYSNSFNPESALEMYCEKSLTSYLLWFSFFLPSPLVASDEIIFSLVKKSFSESGLN